MMVKRRSHFLQRGQIAIIHRQHRISVQALGLAQALHGFKCRRARGRQCGNPSENVGGSICRLLQEGDQRVPKQRQRAGERFGQDGSKFRLLQQELGAVLAKSFSSTLTLLRHTLIAFLEQPANAPADVFARVAALTAASAPAFEAVQRLREAKSLDRDAVLPVYDGYLAALEKVTAALDHHLPKGQWQRAGKTSA